MTLHIAPATFGDSAFHGPSCNMGHHEEINTTLDILPVGDSSVFAPKYVMIYNGFDRSACQIQPDAMDFHTYAHMYPSSEAVDERYWDAFPEFTSFGGYELAYYQGGDLLCGKCAWEFWIVEGVALSPTQVNEDEAYRGVMCDGCNKDIEAPKCHGCATDLAELTEHWPFFAMVDDEAIKVCSRCMAQMVVNNIMQKTGLGEYVVSQEEAPRHPWYASVYTCLKADMSTVEYYVKKANEEKAYRAEIDWPNGKEVTYHDDFADAATRIYDAAIAAKDHQWLDPELQVYANREGEWWFTLMETGGVDAHIYRQHEPMGDEPVYPQNEWRTAHIDNEFETDDIS